MDHFQGNLQTCSWLVRHVNNWFDWLGLPYRFPFVFPISDSVHLMWFKTAFVQQGPLTLTSIPPARPQCYSTNTITWWQTKKTSSALTTNTTGNCDVRQLPLVRPQRCPLIKVGEKRCEQKNRNGWLAVRSWSSFSCNVTKPKIKRDRNLFPHPNPLIACDQCASPTTFDRPPPSAERRPRWPRPPPGEMTKIFSDFGSNTSNGTTPPLLPPDAVKGFQSLSGGANLLRINRKGGRSGRWDLSPALIEQPWHWTASGGEEFGGVGAGEGSGVEKKV